jgi:hypothetical protein
MSLVQSAQTAVADTAASDEVSLHLLGSFSLRIFGVVVEVSLPAQRALGMAALRHFTRAQAARCMSPDADDVHAMGRLRTTIWRLRQICPGLVAEGTQMLQLGPSVRVDVVRLLSWAGQCGTRHRRFRLTVHWARQLGPAARAGRRMDCGGPGTTARTTRARRATQPSSDRVAWRPPTARGADTYACSKRGGSSGRGKSGALASSAAWMTKSHAARMPPRIVDVLTSCPRTTRKAAPATT